jgi:hypothetical protein
MRDFIRRTVYSRKALPAGVVSWKTVLFLRDTWWDTRLLSGARKALPLPYKKWYTRGCFVCGRAIEFVGRGLGFEVMYQFDLFGKGPTI